VTKLYVRSRSRSPWLEKMDERLKSMHIPTCARVLDIGGGSEALAIPLAAQGREVMVIEPSVTMREDLEKKLASSSAGPLEMIPKR
jgi:16S rRNA A1518/A1519 N6-dimethyltransferase RsmA/KsgA/DIM1 with predicted DNA glycosylase/AP lyase activity